MKVFLYGTLKKGFSNHRLMAGQTFVAEAKTLPKYKLYRTSGFPCMVYCEDGKAIIGELWEIDEKCRKNLDYFEGHPHLFRRESVEIQDVTEPVEAYICQNVEGLKEIGDQWDVR